MPDLDENIEVDTKFRSTANDIGAIEWSGDIETPHIGKTKLQMLSITTNSNCKNRSHDLQLFLSRDPLCNATLLDCSEFSTKLDVSLLGGKTYTIIIIAEGFDRGEVVEGEIRVKLAWTLQSVTEVVSFTPSPECTSSKSFGQIES